MGRSTMSDALPTCQSWQKKTAPLACTASTTGLHASTCSSDHIPGVCGITLIPWASGDIPVASVIRRPPSVARCE
uniref:Opr1 n=1 Tax=Arundo donax TaxID=35708 RepID=A0A0A8YEI0_ARUDO